ncbi:MAG: hypothetical protein UR26_C0002G0023 [candidate division TM6 bacterium GW2011_GWF2_32_72]|nr:MAG: hypothetical protein UR26_C0002G0023 [candidate division TM6 bacterium GW2011_GWF2_32_72]
MLSKDILKKIKQIEIKTRRLLSGTLIGDYSSAVKGSGFEFDQIRDYLQGDDVRFIDWKASARANKILVRQYLEERNRNVILAVDVSSSCFFSSSEETKFDVMAQIASVLALVADYGKDGVSLILFADKIELYLPPKRGRAYVHQIMERLFETNDNNSKSNLNEVLKHIASMNRRDSLVFLISDFISSEDDFEKNLKVVAKQYDTVAIRCLDKNECKLPQFGLLRLQDCSTQESVEIQNNAMISPLNAVLNERIKHQNELFKKCGVDLLDILCQDKHFISNVIQFFRKRMRY